MPHQDKGSSIAIIVIVACIVIVAIFATQAQVNNTNKIKEDYRKSIDSAIDSMDEKIGNLYNSGNRIYSAIASECAWQAKNLSSGIGITCHNNAKIPWSSKLGPYADIKDYLVSEEYDDIAYANSILDKGTSSSHLQEGIKQVVDYGNTKYNLVLNQIKDMTQAMASQCEWIVENINSDIGEQCHDTISGFTMANYKLSPFTIEEYQTKYSSSID